MERRTEPEGKSGRPKHAPDTESGKRDTVRLTGYGNLYNGSHGERLTALHSTHVTVDALRWMPFLPSCRGTLRQFAERHRRGGCTEEGLEGRLADLHNRRALGRSYGGVRRSITAGEHPEAGWRQSSIRSASRPVVALHGLVQKAVTEIILDADVY